ncbi:MAG: GTPase ObgE [Candidatus Moranbacteria bacterium CG23_combo_of_CG06-09_8_20_14_all_40_16]|nr:MAG: GTPase ObgE [Candidatus Moranbacteria bacterium CG23_combo_of_CG06-09_8_20_14_all_40_16]
MIVDEIKISLEAGKGGDGLATFDHTKNSQGPSGGKGGRGGDIYFKGVSDLTILYKYRKKDHYEAENGSVGKSNKATGHDGQDLILPVPIGSVINNLDTGRAVEIIEVSQKILAASGGIGGRGNFYFRSPVNTTPTKFEKGKPGEKFAFFIELRLIADIGFIGLPNVGKSSLLNQLTKAQAKVANYHFTTLEPNLGTLDGIILADIPGLIEGASAGRGLGIKFLKHIQRTRFLFHCLSLESTDLVRDYRTIRRELSAYSPDLAKKKEVLVFTKFDLIKEGELKAKLKPFAKKRKVIVSIRDPRSLEKLKKIILKLPLI